MVREQKAIKGMTKIIQTHCIDAVIIYHINQTSFFPFFLNLVKTKTKTILECLPSELKPPPYESGDSSNVVCSIKYLNPTKDTYLPFPPPLPSPPTPRFHQASQPCRKCFTHLNLCTHLLSTWPKLGAQLCKFTHPVFTLHTQTFKSCLRSCPPLSAANLLNSKYHTLNHQRSVSPKRVVTWTQQPYELSQQHQ